MPDVYQRHELKYLITLSQRRALEAAMESRMSPDSHGESTICNIYYDTPDFLLIRRSLEKPVYKEKLRLRSYGRAAPDSEVFLELKKKYAGIVYKRRIPAEAAPTEAAMASGGSLPDDSQISREIACFRMLYKNLEPKVYLCYDRTAWSCPGSSLRITFDTNIRYRTRDLSLTLAPGGEPILPDSQVLLEIKAADAIPLWLAGELSRLGIRQTSFSKYGRAYQLMTAHADKPELRLYPGTADRYLTIGGNQDVHAILQHIG